MADMHSSEELFGSDEAQGSAGRASARPPLRLSLVSDPKAVRLALARVEAEAMRMELDNVQANTVELVLAEVLNNVVEHALAGERFAKIDLCMIREGCRLLFEVRDTGLPMPGGIMPDGAAPASGPALEDLPEGGFGWFLIHSLAEDLSYVRQGDLNLMKFSLSVPSGIS